jgi:hypothetical protein
MWHGWSFPELVSRGCPIQNHQLLSPFVSSDFILLHQVGPPPHGNCRLCHVTHSEGSESDPSLYDVERRDCSELALKIIQPLIA